MVPVSINMLLCLLVSMQLLPTLDIYTWTEEHVVSISLVTGIDKIGLETNMWPFYFFSTSGCSKSLVQVCIFLLQLYTMTYASISLAASHTLCVCISGEGLCDMQLYADLFKENHITGKRLLLLTESDMRDMGVKSKGHIMHLKAG